MAVVNPPQLDTGKTFPGLVLAEETIPLIQLLFRTSEACIPVAVARGASSFTIEARRDELATRRRLFAEDFYGVRAAPIVTPACEKNHQREKRFSGFRLPAA